MIRFIDLGDQLNPGDDLQHCCFAFFNTVPGTFMSFGDEEVFETIGEFTQAAQGSPYLARCLTCIPEGHV